MGIAYAVFVCIYIYEFLFQKKKNNRKWVCIITGTKLEWYNSALLCTDSRF
jgi:hypothetical protein